MRHVLCAVHFVVVVSGPMSMLMGKHILYTHSYLNSTAAAAVAGASHLRFKRQHIDFNVFCTFFISATNVWSGTPSTICGIDVHVFQLLNLR